MRPTRSRAVPVTTGTHVVQTRSVRVGRLVFGSFPPLLRLQPHVHERAMVTVVLEGRFCERFRGREYDCRVGTVLAKPGCEDHDDLFSTGGSTQIILEPEDLGSEQMAPCARFFERIQHFDDGAVEAVARRLAQEMGQTDDISDLAVEALVLELLATAVRRAGSRDGSGAPPDWLRRARELLHDRCLDRLDAVEVAREVGVHPAYLARLFRVHFGVSMGSYARRLRLDRAAHELRGTGESISALALRHGFSDQSHFTRHFKRHTGLTPLQYRRSGWGGTEARRRRE